MSGGHLSKEFFELVKSIGESRAKQEEDKIIVGEIAILKGHLSQPNITPKKMKEYMIRAVYCEMLGHDAGFAYIHAVKLAHEKNLFAKRIGYLTCNLFLHKDHELMLLLINTMQRDLQSSNHLEVCAALTSVSRLVNLEMIPAISPLVFKLLSHPQEVVRKKAIVAVNRFFKLEPNIVLDQKDQIRKVLCDPDPSVMGASLHILFEITRANPHSCKDLIPSFVSILKQITEHRLPRDFDYHRMPAPWLQVKLLSILALLGTADQKASEQMYEILQECMRRADSGVNVGYAIIYECVKCITKIYPDHSLLELAASNISRFISSENHNLKYLGVTGLAQIVQVNASYAAEHQMVVVDCLEDPDDTLKRKTLDLLYRMTNPQNATVVVDKLTFHMRTSADIHLRRELVQRVTSLAERFAPDNEWYVNTMNTVFDLGGDLVPSETAYNLMRLVAEGTGETEEKDHEFRTFAVNTYLGLLQKTSLSDILVQVIAWVLGEYARLVTIDGWGLDDIVDILCETMERPYEDSSTRGYIVNALMKICGQNQHRLSNMGAVDQIVRNYRSSRYTDLQQRCYEFEQLRQSPGLMQKVLPYDASAEDIVVSSGLSFLDGFVKQKLAEGAKPYQDASERAALKESSTEVPEHKSGLNFTPYEAPSKPPVGGGYPNAAPGGGGAAGGPWGAGGGDIESSSPVAPAPAGLNVSGPRKWGPAGYNGPNSGGGQGAPERPPDKPSAPPAPPQEQISMHAMPKASPKAAEPPVMTEKQRMAAALFGGIGAGGGAPASSPTPAPVPKPPRAAAAAAAATATASSAPQAAKPAPPPPSSGGADLMDLLDFDGSSSTNAAPSRPAAPPSTSSPSAANDDLMLLDMGDSSSPIGGTPPAAAAPAGPILGPLPCNTAQVGQQWGSLPSERTIQVATTCVSPQDMMSRLQRAANVHPVEIIGMEGIAAGRVLPGNDPCFLHGKLAPPNLSLLVRCRDPTVAEAVANLCRQAF
mmetsp:Transcript_62189/g.131388  ORF Transcript_62189/g.131388 Transcript_62189/m.131388 type:complete len:988 (+) Transcript_62189:93-3056(+)